MLQQPEADDYVLATGETYSVRQFVEFAFAEVGREIGWEGTGVAEVGKDKKTGEVLVRIDPKYFRPTEVELLLGDPSKAKSRLGWSHKTTFRELVSEMVASDIELIEREKWRSDRSAY